MLNSQAAGADGRAAGVGVVRIEIQQAGARLGQARRRACAGLVRQGHGHEQAAGSRDIEGGRGGQIEAVASRDGSNARGQGDIRFRGPAGRHGRRGIPAEAECLIIRIGARPRKRHERTTAECQRRAQGIRARRC